MERPGLVQWGRQSITLSDMIAYPTQPITADSTLKECEHGLCRHATQGDQHIGWGQRQALKAEAKGEHDKAAKALDEAVEAESSL